MANVIQVKVILLGEQAVGKTCIIRRYVDAVFRENARYNATIGAVFASKSISRGKQKVVLNLWDTAGQERFRSMTRQYYRGAHIAIICYDLTDSKSFDGVQVWVEELNRYEEKCLIFICGTKKDLISEGARVIRPEVVEHYAEQIGAKMIETSSKTGENIEELFELIATDATASQLKPPTSGFALHTSTQKRECRCCNR